MSVDPGYVADLERRLTSVVNMGKDLYGLNATEERLVREIERVTGKKVNPDDYKVSNKESGLKYPEYKKLIVWDGVVNKTAKDKYEEEINKPVIERNNDNKVIDFIKNNPLSNFMENIFGNITKITDNFFALATKWLPWIFVGWFIVNILNVDVKAGGKYLKIDVGD